jgi:serine phosphatase RsbU (regulator of sigma subunit)
VRAAKGESSTGVIDRVMASIDDFAGAAPQFDDITLLVARRT